MAQIFFSGTPAARIEFDSGTGYMMQIANEMIVAAQDYLDQLVSVTFDPIEIDPNFPTVDAAPVPISTLPPTFQEVTWVTPDRPTEWTGSLDVEGLLPDPFDQSPPTLVFGTAPAEITETLPDAPAVNLTFDDPTLTVDLPAPPSLLSISILPFDGVTMPTIDYDIPELTVAVPTKTTYTPGTAYSSQLLTQLKADLLSRITNGGTGLNPDVENAIWDRAREREARNKANALDELERMESLGYAAPPGVYMNARIKIETEMAAVNAGLSREIAIKQAELELQNVQKALDQSLALEGKLLDINEQIEQRTLEAAKYATEADIAIYNAQVQAYSAYVDAYKLKVAIYEAQVRAALSEVEIYKAQVEAEMAKAQVNTALVQMYKAQADVALANVEIYKAEIAAIQTKAEIERTKVQVYGEQIKGFVAKINAYTAQVEGFRASIQAEATKQDAYKSSVEAYRAQVDAATSVIGARIEEFKALIDAKNFEWEAYKTAAEAESARARAIAANNQSLADAYRAEVSGITSYNQALTQQWEASVRQALAVTEIGVSTAKANGDLALSAASLASDAAKIGAQVTAQIGASALNAVNFSASLGLSDNYNRSESNSNSYSENHNYNYSV